MQKSLGLTVSVTEVTPVKLHKYPSYVRKPFFKILDRDLYNAVFHRLQHVFLRAGIEVVKDNKIVFECEVYGSRIYFGFCDLTFSIGFDYFDENEHLSTL